MAVERTLSIIKPDATEKNVTGAIIKKFEDAGLRVVAQKRLHMSKEMAGKFYEVHAERPFYDELTTFMSVQPTLQTPTREPFERNLQNLLVRTPFTDRTASRTRKLKLISFSKQMKSLANDFGC